MSEIIADLSKTAESVLQLILTERGVTRMLEKAKEN